MFACRRFKFTLSFATLTALLLGASAASAETITITTADDPEAAINALNPGDELIISGGMYTLTSKFSVNVSGTAAMPIIIRAKDGETPHFHRPSAGQNIIDFESAHYLEIYGIEFSGGSAGVRLQDVSNFTLEDCEIHDTADVALRANDDSITYESLRIIHNHIHHTDGTGEGMYLGCNENKCRVANSIIARNYVHDTNGPNIVQGDGIELKEGSYGNIIADNVIHDTHWPCILTYSTVGNGAANIIERNVMWNCALENPADNGIQVSQDAVVRNNIIYSAGASGISCQPHQSGVPGNLIITHNTVVMASGNAIRCSGIEGNVVIANNALYAQNGNALRVDDPNLGALTILGNAGFGTTQGVTSGFVDSGMLDADFVAASYGGSPPNDVFPSMASLLIAGGDSGNATAVDFNATPRDGVADIGAYKYDAAGNPGWEVGPGFKDIGDVGGTGGGGGGQGGNGQGGAAQGSGGSSNGSAAGGNSGSGGDGGDNEDDGGCSCRAAGAPLGDGMGWLLIAAAALGLSRRRRRDR